MKLKSLLFTFLLGGCFSTAMAQSYESSITPQQNILGYGETFTFSFTGIPAGGYGDAQLIVYFSGDFGDDTEYGAVVDEDASTLGQAGPYSSGNDCDGLDSIVLTFDATLIDGWLADNQVDFMISPTGDVDPGNCTESFFQCRLVYDYCAFGEPVTFASFTPSQDVFCTYDDAIMLTGTPASGTWSGVGVSGNMFNPQGLTAGSSVQITYTATDAIGCVTTATGTVRIKGAPSVTDTHACPGGTAELSVNSGGTYVWFEDDNLTQIIDTNVSITTDALNQTTQFYVAGLYSTSSFVIDSLGITDSLIIDHDIESGDDRGGVAITPDYFYVVGDNNTVRVDALDLANPISLPIRDGIFSDLGTGNLYTLWNTDEDDTPNGNNAAIPVNSIRGLDEDLNLTAEINALDMEIPVEYGSIVLAGNGFLGIISAADGHVYVVDLDDFSVNDLGPITNVQNYGSENWADWGVLEYDGTDFSAVYSTWNYEVVRHNVTTDVVTTLATFPSDLSDMSSFTVSPWNNRWYFHYEGYSDVFGGNSETAGYANAGMTSAVIESNELGCYSEIEVFVSDINLGQDSTACEYNVPVMLFAGNGYESYSWNGVNNNYNVFAAMESGEYVVVAVDEFNCEVADTIVVTLDECLGVQEQDLFTQVELYPNPTQGNANLRVNSAFNTAAQCMIIDVNGNVLFSSDVNLTAGENNLEIETASFATGVYLVRLSDNTGRSSVVRLVKN